MVRGLMVQVYIFETGYSERASSRLHGDAIPADF